MAIPGSNILEDALTVIDSVEIQFFENTARSKNSIGLYDSTYAAAIPVQAGVQAVKRNQYRNLGLDFNKHYIMLWSSHDFKDLARDRGADQIEFNSKRYELMNEDDWTALDQWNSALAVEIANL
jgi:hypothetical protein